MIGRNPFFVVPPVCTTPVQLFKNLRAGYRFGASILKPAVGNGALRCLSNTVGASIDTGRVKICRYGAPGALGAAGFEPRNDLSPIRTSMMGQGAAVWRPGQPPGWKHLPEGMVGTDAAPSATGNAVSPWMAGGGKRCAALSIGWGRRRRRYWPGEDLPARGARCAGRQMV